MTSPTGSMRDTRSIRASIQRRDRAETRRAGERPDRASQRSRPAGQRRGSRRDRSVRNPRRKTGVRPRWLRTARTYPGTGTDESEECGTRTTPARMSPRKPGSPRRPNASLKTSANTSVAPTTSNMSAMSPAFVSDRLCRSHLRRRCVAKEIDESHSAY